MHAVSSPFSWTLTLEIFGEECEATSLPGSPLPPSHTLSTPTPNSRLPITAIRVPPHLGFAVEKCGTGAGFMRVLGLPLPMFVTSAAPYSAIVPTKTSRHLDTD
jgi:hypothetical protein